ncbi:TetR/AcrR family transcriptional regulator [Caulobacter sp. UNC358MFTsu5.1]|uniref:TetR/AcrR family transcriptional regulator n=1 Tax=Caulobacter sp. UNC358MFTsu5.1 TaxID=1449049 RepID=UPI0004A6F3DD|nr:TetR/AcrR family transcriptional regulator [Caulobacter sp. UNC358MFTsu5.1]
MTDTRLSEAPPRRRYSTSNRDRRRAEIVAAASEEINAHGLHGLMLADVAATVGMTKANLTYYFRRKEDLASACVSQTLAAYRVLVAQAGAAQSARARVEALYALFFERAGRQAAGLEPPLVMLSSLQALGEAQGPEVVELYAALLRDTAKLFEAPDAPPLDRARRRGRAQLALTHLFWAVAWSRQVDPGDYPRCARRLFDIVADGLCEQRALPSDHAVNAIVAAALPADPTAQRWAFYQAATRIINQLGYRGASVDRIGAAVNVTKGSVYHHHQSKDDVVRACSERSFAAMWAIMRAAQASSDDPWAQVAGLVTGLTAFQTGEDGPLLRAVVLGALPEHLGEAVMLQWTRVTQHLAGVVSDASAAGAVRRVDPFLAAQVIAAAVNAADEIRALCADAPPAEAGGLCARAALFGLLSPLAEA